jgi:hypothetical protein
LWLNIMLTMPLGTSMNGAPKSDAVNDRGLQPPPRVFLLNIFMGYPLQMKFLKAVRVIISSVNVNRSYYKEAVRPLPCSFGHFRPRDYFF